MFPYFDFFNSLITRLVKFNKNVVLTLKDSRLTDKQKVATLKLFAVTHEDDLVVDYAKIIAKGIFDPESLPGSDKPMVVQEAFGINVIYCLN